VLAIMSGGEDEVRSSRMVDGEDVDEEISKTRRSRTEEGRTKGRFMHIEGLGV
jgi:hypothetical protein